MQRISNILIGVLLVLFSYSASAQTILLQEGFESIPFGLTSSGTATWGQNSNHAANGNFSISSAIASPGDSAVLTSGSFSTIGMSQVVLRFNQICKMDFFDGGYLEVSNDNGITWNRLTGAHYKGYGMFANFSNKFNAFSYVDWQPMQPSQLPSASWWKHEAFDISALAANASQVRIRFVMQDMDNNGAAGNFGWLLDDVRISGGTSDLIPPDIFLSSTSPTDSVAGTGPFQADATIIDSQGVAAAWIVYSIGALNDSTPMVHLGNNVWSGVIPSAPYQSSICYKVVAKDSSQYQNTNQFPASGCISFTNYKAPVVVQAGTATTQGHFSPIFNETALSLNRYSHHVSLFTPSDMNGLQGEIQRIAWEKANNTSYAGANARMRIYIKHSSSAYVPATAAALASEWAGATLVYEDTTMSLPVSNGWQTFQFNKSNFQYNGTSNLMVLVEWFRDGNLTGDFVNWSYTMTPQMAATYYGSTASPATAGGTGHRPNTRFSINTTNFPLDASIASIVAPTGVFISAQAVPVTVRVKNSGMNTLHKTTIHWSINGNLQTPYVWTGSLGTDLSSGDVVLGTISFPTGTSTIMVWTTLPNDSADMNPYNDTLITQVFGCPAILNGTYTLGTPASDFATFNDLFTALHSCGIVGPSIIRVMPGTYAGPFKITDSIQGLSDINTLTITSYTQDPASVVLVNPNQSTAANYVVNLDKVNYVTLDRLRFVTTGTSAGQCITLTGNASNNVISNCILDMAYGENFEVNGIVMSGGCNYNHLIGNKITNGYRNIVATGNTNTKVKGLVISGNTLTDGSRYAADISHNDSLILTGNTVYCSFQAPSSSRYGLSINQSTRSTITANKIHMHLAGFGYAIWYQSNNDAAASRSLIANNFIAVTGTSTTYGSHAILYTGSSNTKIYHNSMLLTTGNSTASTINFEGSSSGVWMKNNAIANTGGGFAMNSNASGSGSLQQSNYNSFFTTGATLARWNGTTLIPVTGGIGALTNVTFQDTNSIMTNPLFYSNTNLHSFSPAMNNAGTPLADVVTDIDGEPRSATTPDIGADEYTVSALDAGVMAITSPSGNLIQGAQQPLKVLIRNFGTSTLTSVPVTCEITGINPVSGTWTGSISTGQTDTLTLPSITIPPMSFNIKAYTTLSGDTLYFNDTTEAQLFGNPLVDLKVENLLSPAGGCNPGSDSVKVTIRNIGSQASSGNFTLGYQRNGLPLVQETLTVSLTANGTYIHTFSTPVSLVTNQDTLFELSTWVKISGDPNAGNDSLNSSITVQGPLPDPLVQDTTISYGQSVALTATSNYPVEWFNVPSGGLKLSTSPTFVTPPLFDTTTYYVQANTNIPAGEFYIGQGTEVSGQYQWPNPFGKAFGGAKHQYLVLASEMLAQGYSAGDIASVSFFSSSALGNITGVDIRIGTTPNNATTTTFVSTPMTLVFSGTLSITAGWITVNFPTPYPWDGASNLVIQTMTASGATLINPPIVYEITSFSSVTYFLGTGAATATTGTVSVNRPNFRFNTLGAPGCNSSRVPVTVIVPPLQRDVMIGGFDAPVSGCGLNPTPVTIQVINHGYDTIFGGIQTRYRINNGAYTAPENISSTILPYDTLHYTFSTQAALPSGATSQKHVITAVVTMAGDMYTLNDTLVSDSITSVYTPASFTVAPVTIPYGSVATLTPTASDTLYWYHSPTSQTSFKQGIPFVTPPLYDTSVWYVESRFTTPLNTHQIGTGTTYNGSSSYPSPYGSTQFGAKHQFLIRASELIAAGMMKGEVRSIGFNVAGTGSTQLQDYTIAIGHTTQNTMGTFETNLTPYFFASNYQVTNGVNEHAGITPFVWDGFSNIVIETCFKNSGNGTLSMVYNHSPGYSASLIGIGGATFQCGTVAAGSSFTTRPNIYLKVISRGDCVSARVPVQVNVSGIPAVDASVTQIISPVGQAASNIATPVVVELKNWGTNALTSATIHFQSGNQPIGSYSWTGNLPRLATTQVTPGNVNFTGGIENLKVWVSTTGDQTPQNDTAEVILPVCMQGTYAIGTSKRYTTINQAINELKQAGVCGHTVFAIDPGIYGERFQIPAIQGTSASATITLTSANSDSSSVNIVALTTAQDPWVISLMNSSYVTIRNLSITANGSSNGYAISIDGTSNQIQIGNNILNGATSNASGLAAAVYSASPNIQQVQIYHNVINNGYSGVHLNGVSGSMQKNVTIYGNRITDFYRYGIYAYFQDSLTIRHNIIKSGNNEQYYYGVRAQDLTGGINIYSNFMELYPTSYGYGIEISNATGTAVQPGLIYNNMISLLTGTGAHQAMASSNNQHLTFAFNSINIKAPSTTSRAMQVGSGGNIRILSNSFVVDGAGHAFYTTLPGTISTMDYNNYYTSPVSQTFVHWGGAITSFAAFQAFDPSKNANSINVDPLYKSMTDLHTDNILLNSKATPVSGITTDFDGDLRNPLTPDIGADEFFPAPYDLAMVRFVNPSGSSCGFTMTDSVIVRIRNAGENTFDFSQNPATMRVIISGQVNDTLLVQITTGTLTSGQVMDVVVHNGYNLSVPGHYQMIAEITSGIDTVPGNNTLNPFRFVSLPKINTFPYHEDFESGYNLTFLEYAGNDATIDVDANGAATGIRGLHLQGGGYASSWNNASTVDLAFANSSKVMQVKTCEITPTSGLKMKFDLRQTYTTLGNPNTSWVRVMLHNINGSFYLHNQMGDSVFRAITPDQDPFMTHIFDLQNYAQQPFSISIDAVCRLRMGEGSFSGDNVFIDNVNWWVAAPNDVAVQSLAAPSKPYNKTGNLQNVSLVVINLGTQTVTSLPASYQVSNLPVVNETFAVNIPSMGVDTITFTVPFITQPGLQNICVSTLLPGDGNPSNDTLCMIFKGVNTFVVPYADDFEGNDEWISSGINQQWALGTPASAVINGPASGLNAWATGLTQPYYPSSIEYLYSPYFIIPAGITDTATLSFKQWMSVIPDQAYGIIQYSINQGQSWNNIGYIGSTDGVNWYNSIVTGLHCWSATTPGWITSTHPLYPYIFNIGMPFQFRFTFYTTNYHLTNDGWAIDDFSITIPPPAWDAHLIEVTSPSASTPIGAASAVTVKVLNKGTDTIQSINFGYRIDAQAPVSEIWQGNLPAGDTLTYTYNTLYNAPINDYVLCAFAKVSGDLNSFNDTLCHYLMATPGFQDAGVTAVITPTGQVTTGATTQVTVNLHNFGLDTLNTIPVSYSVGSLLVATETFQGVLLPGQSLPFTFSTTFVSPAGYYSLCARTLLTGDVNQTNDEFCEPILATGIHESGRNSFAVGQNIPNPAKNTTFIPVTLSESGLLEIRIYSLTGKLIDSYLRQADSGKNLLEINIHHLADGVYLYSVQHRQELITRRLTILR